MNESHETARELATHASDIRHLQENSDRVARDVADIKKDLADIKVTLAEARGGWKMLMLLGGAGGVFGALLTHFFKRIFS